MCKQCKASFLWQCLEAVSLFWHLSLNKAATAMEGNNTSIYMHRNSNNHDEWIPDANFNVCSRAPLRQYTDAQFCYADRRSDGGCWKLICMPNCYLNVDIYFNSISYPHIPHGRLLWQSHINLWLVNIHLAKSPSTWWIFMRWARLSPHSSPSSMAPERICLFLQARAHAAIIVLIFLQLDLRVTVAQFIMAYKSVLPAKESSLKGREEKMVVAGKFRLVKFSCQAAGHVKGHLWMWHPCVSHRINSPVTHYIRDIKPVVVETTTSACKQKPLLPKFEKRLNYSYLSIN